MTKNQTAELNRDTQALLGEDAVRPFWKKPLVWLFLCLVLAALAYFFLWPSSGPKSAVSYKTAKVETGDLVIEVSANGTLNPIRTVSLGSELSGVVRKVNVDVNDEIKTGQVLVELDDTKLKAAVERARATLALSEAGLAEAQATEKEARVKLLRLQEVRRLSGGKSPSKTEIDSQEAVLARAVASVSSAKAQILDSKEALKSAETDLSKTHISSPIDGIVLTRTVENGQAVAASLQAVELLSLATDMRHLELQINVDEADVGAVKPGLPAYFTVSAYPDRRFPATLKKVAFGSTTTDNVVTYITYLDVDNPQLDLRPGMTATANIRTVSLKDATLVPNTALRFKPSNAAPAKESVTAGMFGPPKRDAVQKTAKDVGGSAGVQREGTVYVLRNGAPQAVKLVIGYSDGKMTQVVKGDISPKDEVIVNQLRGAK
jgi:HlyD family secretion protein